MEQGDFFKETMKFIADRTLGKLAKGLRMLGYDTVYYRGDDFHQLIHIARQEGRILVTRNTKLALRRPKDHIITLTENHPSRQLEELIRKGKLSFNDEVPFTRCIPCNGPLEDIPRDQAEGKVPDFIFHQQKDFFHCRRCDKIYWQGSHLGNMQKRVKELLHIKSENRNSGEASRRDQFETISND
jgi:uncharacterized protein with PIN domain